MTRRLAAAAAIALAALPACRGRSVPTEKAMVVRVAAAPGLSEPSPSSLSDRTVRWGEVFRAGGATTDLHWQGGFGGQTVTRVGFVELRRGLEDPPRWAASADLLEADVPTTAWLCAQIDLPSDRAATCEANLRRVVAAETTLLAYLPCWRGECPLLAIDKGAVHRATLPGLSEVRVVSVEGRPVALARTSWHRSRDETGSDLVVLGVAPPLARLGEVRLSRTDARDPQRVTHERARASIEGGVLVVEGRRSVRDRVTNQEREGAPIAERFGLGDGGKLVPR